MELLRCRTRKPNACHSRVTEATGVKASYSPDVVRVTHCLLSPRADEGEKYQRKLFGKP